MLKNPPEGEIRNCRKALVMCALFAASEGRGQSNLVSRPDSLDLFVGTWIAANANESAPFMILRLEERGGKLVGAMNHFRFGVAGPGKLVGSSPTSDEIPLPDLSVSPGAFWFTWRGSPPFEGSQARFVVEGTRVAHLIFSLPPSALQKIRAGNPRASGLNPVMSLTRVSRNPHELLRREGIPAQPKPSQRAEAASMARLINTAEVRYMAAHGQYADYPTLMRSDELKQTAEQEFTVPPGNLNRQGYMSELNPLPGFSFRLALAPDRKSYQVTMRENVSGRCRYDVSTDETGVVTESAVLGAQCE